MFLKPHEHNFFSFCQFFEKSDNDPWKKVFRLESCGGKFSAIYHVRRSLVRYGRGVRFPTRFRTYCNTDRYINPMPHTVKVYTLHRGLGMMQKSVLLPSVQQMKLYLAVLSIFSTADIAKPLPSVDVTVMGTLLSRHLLLLSRTSLAAVPINTNGWYGCEELNSRSTKRVYNAIKLCDAST